MRDVTNEMNVRASWRPTSKTTTRGRSHEDCISTPGVVVKTTLAVATVLILLFAASMGSW